MLLYILLVPACILLIISIIQMLNIRKHDRVLYMYCQLRRNILTTLRETPVKDWSESDYQLINNLSEYIDVTIHEFSSSIKKDSSLIFAKTNNKEIQKHQQQLKVLVG